MSVVLWDRRMSMARARLEDERGVVGQEDERGVVGQENERGTGETGG